jgi:hypothetical protein
MTFSSWRGHFSLLRSKETENRFSVLGHKLLIGDVMKRLYLLLSALILFTLSLQDLPAVSAQASTRNYVKPNAVGLNTGASWDDTFNDLQTEHQRGGVRPQGAVTDGIAFERQANVTTVFRSTGAYDGHVLESTETSGVGGVLYRIGSNFHLGDANGDKQYRGILSFNTASLPDNATIVKATLKIRKRKLTGTDPFTILGPLVVDIRRTYFGSSIGLTIGDFQAVANRSAITSFNAIPVNGWYSALIDPAEFPLIYKAGTTQFRLRFTTDDNDDDSPDYMLFYSGNWALEAARPTLIVEYSVP